MAVWILDVASKYSIFCFCEHVKCLTAMDGPFRAPCVLIVILFYLQLNT